MLRIIILIMALATVAGAEEPPAAPTYGDGWAVELGGGASFHEDIEPTGYSLGGTLRNRFSRHFSVGALVEYGHATVPRECLNGGYSQLCAEGEGDTLFGGLETRAYLTGTESRFQPYLAGSIGALHESANIKVEFTQPGYCWGWTSGQCTSSVPSSTQTFSENASRTNLGFRVGGGFDWFLNERVFVGVDGAYVFGIVSNYRGDPMVGSGYGRIGGKVGLSF